MVPGGTAIIKSDAACPRWRAGAMFAGLGLKLALMRERLQGVQVRVDRQDDIAAVAAIAAIRPAAGMYFSRRKWTTPLPPSPERTVMIASSKFYTRL